ncbi:MAG: MerR family transcriptional regulator [Armatimonadetes bacterium]|nr:MerR family transcriptional regulator [Armatimonadota bacterium]
MADDRRDEPLYLISVVARLCEMHPQSIRLYERLGLIRPRYFSRRRFFSDADIERLRQIRRLTQEMGVNLAGVEIILDLLDKISQLQEEVESLKAERRRATGAFLLPAGATE